MEEVDHFPFNDPLQYTTVAGRSRIQNSLASWDHTGYHPDTPGVTALWDLDSVNPLQERVGLNGNAVNVQDLVFTPGRFGKSVIDFTTLTAGLEILNVKNSFFPESGEYTLFALAKTTDAISNFLRYVIGFGDLVNNGLSIGYVADITTLRLFMPGTIGLPVLNVADGLWHSFWVVSSPSQNLRALYVDGVLQTSSTHAAVPPNPSSIRIGASGAGGNSWQGAIQNVAVLDNTGLTPAQITARVADLATDYYLDQSPIETKERDYSNLAAPFFGFRGFGLGYRQGFTETPALNAGLTILASPVTGGPYVEWFYNTGTGAWDTNGSAANNNRVSTLTDAIAAAFPAGANNYRFFKYRWYPNTDGTDSPDIDDFTVDLNLQSAVTVAGTSTRDYNQSWDCLLADILRMVGLIGLCQEPDACRLEMARRAVQRMLKAWGNEGIRPHHHVARTQALVASSEVLGSDGQSYRCFVPHTSTVDTAPVTGNLWTNYWIAGGTATVAHAVGLAYTSAAYFAVDADVIRVLERAFVRWPGGHDFEVDQMTFSEYQETTTKWMQGTPTGFVFRKAAAGGGEIILDPQPLRTDYVFHYDAVLKMEDADLAGAFPDLTPAWLEAVQYGGAKRVADMAQKRGDVRLYYKNEAAEALRIAKRGDREPGKPRRLKPYF
jgi:hypothetical protein